MTLRIPMLALVIAAGGVLGGCAAEHSGASRYPATPGNAQADQSVAPSSIVPHELSYGGAQPVPGQPVPEYAHLVWGNLLGAGMYGGDAEILPEAGWRWVNPGDVHDSRVVETK